MDLGGQYYRLGSQSDQAQELAEKIRRERSCSDMDRKPVTVRSYANIAIIKYWGKKKEKRDGSRDQQHLSDFRKHVHRDDTCLLYRRMKAHENVHSSDRCSRYAL